MCRCVYPRRGRGLTEGVTACAVGARAHLRSAYRWCQPMWMRNTMGDGGRCGRQPPKSGCIIVAPGWLAYLGLVVEGGNLPPKSGCRNYLQTEGCVYIYNRSSAVVVNVSMSRGRQANPVLTYETALRRFFCDTPRRVGQSDDVGNRDGGEVAYLRHAEFGVEENPGTLRCALHTGLRMSAVALRRERQTGG